MSSRVAGVLCAFAVVLAGAASAGAEVPQPGYGLWVNTVTATRSSTNPSELEIVVAFDEPIDPSTGQPGQTVLLSSIATNSPVPIAREEFEPNSETLDLRVENAGEYGPLRLYLAGDSAGGSPVIAALDGTPLGATSTHPLGRNYTSNLAPTVSSVAVPPAGTYGLGTDLDFVVTMSEPTFVNTTGGNPSLPITLGGGSTVYAYYLSGSETEALTFRYSVEEGDTGGIVLGSALRLNGGALADAAGDAAVLTLANWADTSGIRLDGIGPSSTPTKASGTSSNSAMAGALSAAAMPAAPPVAAPVVGCTSRRAVVVHVLVPHGVHLRRTSLSINGRRLATLHGDVTAVPVSFRGRPAGAFLLAIRATTTKGLHLVSLHRYHLCSAVSLPPGRDIALHRAR